MVNALTNERYVALQNIAYHPIAEHDVRGNEDPRDWKWEATSMRRIAQEALLAHREKRQPLDA
jgi:uncharacterized MAPEG superfamily protein